MGLENGAHSYLYQPENDTIVVFAGESRSVQIEILPDNIEPQTGAPGSPLVWLVVVKNTGNAPENYTLTVNELLSGVSHTSVPRIGWGATLDNTILVLNPCVKAATYLRVTVPSDAKTFEWDAITVTVTGTGVEDSYTVRAQVLQPGPRTPWSVIDICVDAQIVAIDVNPLQWYVGIMDEGENQTSPIFNVRNTGNVTEDIYAKGVDAQSMPGEPVTTWTLASSPSIDEYQLDMILGVTPLTTSDQLAFESVGSGDERNFNLKIYSPSVITTPARMWTRVVLTAVITSKNSYNLITKPVITATVSVPFGENTEGTIVTVPVTITNNSSVWDNFSLSVCDSKGWTLSLPTTLICLENGASTTVNLTVTIPPRTGGEIDTVMVTAKSSESGDNFSGYNQVKSLSSPASEVTILSGNNIAHCSVVNTLIDPCFRYDPLTIAVTVQNRSILDHDYLLTFLTDNIDLGLKLTPDELFLPAGDTGYVALSVTIPDTWWAGWSGTITVVATPKSFGKSGKIEIRKVDEENKLLSGATFKVEPNPYGGAFLLVTDGGIHDADPSDGVVLLENVPVGTYTVMENVVPAGYQGDTTVDVFDVTPHAMVTVTFVNKLVNVLGKIEIRKVDEENKLLDGATFKVSPSPYGAGDLLVTDGGAHDSDPTFGIVLLEDVPLGTYTITENVAPPGYQADNGIKVVDVTSSVTVSVTFTDKKLKLKLVTRTIGFWATHVAYTENVWSYVDNKMIGTKTIDDNGKLFGAFWSNISKKSNGSKRTALDQARMQLLQQLVGAMLNVQAFGDDGTGAALIAAGKAAFIGTDKNLILSVANQLDTFNQSGDSSPLPPGVNPGPADPKGAKAIANIPFWDNLTLVESTSGITIRESLEPILYGMIVSLGVIIIGIATIIHI
jgi:hypothetical protein